MRGTKAKDRRLPLPRRTGHADFPHPALAKVVSARKHSQRYQAHVGQVSMDTDTFTHPPASLTTTVQVVFQALAHETIEVPECLARISQTKIIGPASQVAVESFNQFEQWVAALFGADPLAQRVWFPRHRFLRGLQVPVAFVASTPIPFIPKGVAQEIQALPGLLHIQHASLLPVDLQPQPSFQFTFDPAPQLRTDVASQYDEVVRVANQLCPGPLRRSIRPLKPVVEPVQVDVGQQRTQDSSLRGASVVATHRRRFSFSRRFHHRRFKPLSNQSQDRAIHHPHPYASHQLVPRDCVEVASQVCVVHRRFAFLEVLTDVAQCVVRRPAGSEPVRAFLEVSLEDWLQYQLHGPLHHPITHRRNAQRSQFSIGLGDIDSQDRFGLVSPLQQAPLDVFNKCSFLFRCRRNLFDTPSIYARCAVVVPDRCPRNLQHVPPTHQSVETVEAKPLLLFGFLSQLLSQFPDFGRQDRFSKGKLLFRLFCRGSFHFNQFQVLLTRHDLGQGSLAPSRVNRDFTATMSPSDTAIRPHQRLWLPVRGCLREAPNRVSQVPGCSFGARCLLPPRGVRLVHWVVASQAMLASPSLAGWPLPSKRNEAEPSSRDATARAFASPSLGEQSCPHSLWVWLRDFRPIITINTFQLTRTAKLAWRFPKNAENAKEGTCFYSRCVLCVLCGLIAEEFCRAPRGNS